MSRGKKKVKSLLKLQQQAYCYCGVRLDWDNYGCTNTATIEHLVPESQGGTYAKVNCIIVCSQCNYRRNVQDWYKWVATNKLVDPEFLLKQYDNAVRHYLTVGKNITVKIPKHLKNFQNSQLTTA